MSEPPKRAELADDPQNTRKAWINQSKFIRDLTVPELEGAFVKRIEVRVERHFGPKLLQPVPFRSLKELLF